MNVGFTPSRRTERPSHVFAVRLAMIFAASAVVPMLAGTSRAQVFPPDAPIWVDPDRLDMPAPEPHDINDYFDFWINTFGEPGTYDGPALNVNSVGDVPASSWYTLRHYWERMFPEELARGPNRLRGPADKAPWRVVAGKLEGKTAGLQVEDARGDRYVLKFDVPGHIEANSGAEVIATKLLYALGYNVPQNYPVRFARSRLVPTKDAVFETAAGEVPITGARIDSILEGAARYEDGTYRALASLYLEGQAIGPFLFYGTRPDDGNDIFPHEGRRELRGLRVISAWLNHTDARSANTLDVVVEEDGRQFVRHHLIDFGATLGVGAGGPKRRWDSYEYVIDGSAILKRMFTLGAAGLEWADIDYPDTAAIGRFEAAHFEPDEWRPQYPNAAFSRMDAEDAFWAAKQIAALSEEGIRAIVETADFSNPHTGETLIDILLRRRDKIARSYLSHGGGLDRFDVRYGVLSFEDLLKRHGLATADRVRHAIWRPFNNQTGEQGSILAARPVTGRHLSIPEGEHDYLVVDIRTTGAGATRIYLRSDGGEYEVAGVDRSGP